MASYKLPKEQAVEILSLFNNNKEIAIKALDMLIESHRVTVSSEYVLNYWLSVKIEVYTFKKIESLI